MKVRNINGINSNACYCKNWLTHWETFSCEKSSKCVEKTCTQDASVGAHVQKQDLNDGKWYIVPLCDHHNNQRGNELELYRLPKLVSANVSVTCG